MRQPESLPECDPRRWMDRARSDLALARSRPEGVHLADLCFHAQQAAEKAIKALLIRHGVEFPYIHDLTVLLTLLEDAGEAVPPQVKPATALTPYAAVTRYPGIGDRMTEEEYADALEVAETVVRWAQDNL